MKKNIKTIALSLCAIIAIALGTTSVMVWQEYNSFHPEDYIATANSLETAAAQLETSDAQAQLLNEAETIRYLAERDGASIGMLALPGILFTLLTIVLAIPCVHFLWKWTRRKEIPAIQI